MSAAELLIQPTTVTDLVNSSTKDSGEDDGGGGDDGQETKHKNLVWLEDGFQYYVISLIQDTKTTMTIKDNGCYYSTPDQAKLEWCPSLPLAETEAGRSSSISPSIHSSSRLIWNCISVSAKWSRSETHQSFSFCSHLWK